MKRVVSERWTLQGRDWWNGLLIAVISAVLISVQQTIDAGTLAFDWKAIGMGSIAAIASYVLKNLTEPTKVVDVATGDEAKAIIEQSK